MLDTSRQLNISQLAGGRSWIAMTNPRNAVLDRSATWPGFIRSAIWQLPDIMRPNPETIVWAGLGGQHRAVRAGRGVRAEPQRNTIDLVNERFDRARGLLHPQQPLVRIAHDQSTVGAPLQTQWPTTLRISDRPRRPCGAGLAQSPVDVAPSRVRQGDRPKRSGGGTCHNPSL